MQAAPCRLLQATQAAGDIPSTGASVQISDKSRSAVELRHGRVDQELKSEQSQTIWKSLVPIIAAEA